MQNFMHAIDKCIYTIVCDWIGLYKACCKNNTRCTIVAHDIRGRWWWYGSRGWIFPLISYYLLLPCDRWQRGSQTKWCLHPLTFIDTFWMFMEAKQWMWPRWGSGDSDMIDKPRWSCTAVTPWEDGRLNQLICVNWWISARDLCVELNISFIVLEMIVAALEYCKVCNRWVHEFP